MKVYGKNNSIFDEITDLEFEEILNECGFNYTKVEKGNGGLFINNTKISSKTLGKEYELLIEFEKRRKYSRINKITIHQNTSYELEYPLKDIVV